MTIPLAPVLGLTAGLIGPAKDMIDGNVEFAVNKLKYSYLGIRPDGTLDPMGLVNGMLPIVAGALVHKYVGGKLGVNRMLGNAGVPVIRL